MIRVIENVGFRTLNRMENNNLHRNAEDDNDSIVLFTSKLELLFSGTCFIQITYVIKIRLFIFIYYCHIYYEHPNFLYLYFYVFFIFRNIYKTFFIYLLLIYIH